MNKLLTGVITSAMLSLTTSANADWSFKGLGTLGGNFSQATAINDAGQVVGQTSYADGSWVAFNADPNGSYYLDIGSFGGTSLAYDINAGGRVAGSSFNGNNFDSKSVAFVTGQNDVGIFHVDALNNKTSVASGINDLREIAGTYTNDLYDVITGPDGSGLRDLGSLGGDMSTAQAINNPGQVAGWSTLANRDVHAFITGNDGIGMRDIGTLGGSVSQAFDINESGQVVGTSTFSQYPSLFHAFVTGSDGNGMIDLGTLGGQSSSAFAINDMGEVAGYAQTENGTYHSFIYSHGGITDLSLLDPVIATGWSGLTVLNINNNGQMVGHGVNSQGNTEAFYLAYSENTVFNPQQIHIPPIPEPSTLNLVY